MSDVDWTSPCARAIALRSAYYQLISGGGVTRVVVRGDANSQETEFQKADVATLMMELRHAETECAALGNVGAARPPRFAIRGGAGRFKPDGSGNGGQGFSV